MFVDPRGGQCFVSFCYKATPVIVVEQRTKVNKQRGCNEKNARKSLQFPAPVFGLGGAAEHPVTSPFAALTGHSAAIAETGRLTDQRMELDEYEMARVDAELQRLQELLPRRPTASITYFVPDERKNGGSYQTVTGSVKRIDAVNGVIQMTDRQCIPIADVFSIEIIP